MCAGGTAVLCIDPRLLVMTPAHPSSLSQVDTADTVGLSHMSHIGEDVNTLMCKAQRRRCSRDKCVADCASVRSCMYVH